MTILLFVVLPMLAVPVAACIVHDIRWSRQLAASNARNKAWPWPPLGVVQQPEVKP